MDIDLMRRGGADQEALIRLVEECAALDDPADGGRVCGTRVRLRARLGNVRQTV
jgi:hypothetical protein